MSHSTIPIPSDSIGESVGSSPSLVILSDTEAEVMAIPAVLPEITLEAVTTVIVAPPTATLDLAIESDPEVEPSEALPSLDYVSSSPIHALASPDYHLGTNTKSEPFEDESEPIEDAPEAAKPLPLRMIVRPQHPLPLGYRAAITRWSAAPLSTSYPSHSPKDSASMSVSSSVAPFVPHSGQSRRRSCPVSSSSSSSSSTSHALSGPLSHRRHLVPYHFITNSIIGTNDSSSVPVDRLPPRKRFRGSPAILYYDVTIEAAAEPINPPVHHGLMVDERLDEIEETKKELQTLRDRVVSLEKENSSLRVRVRAAKLSDDSTQVALQNARTGLAEMRRQVRDTVEQLQQCQIARMYDRECISMIEEYLRRYF
ncbi:hypothetical protein Tco_1186011 [Tanacetum coccineum]